MKITHIGQRHQIPNMSEDALKLVEISQYNVAKFIIEYHAGANSPIIIDETLAEKFDSSNPEFKKQCPSARDIFPDGFPKSFSSLTEKQKYVLPYGAAKILCCLGIIKEVHPCTDKEGLKKLDEIQDKIQNEMVLELASNMMYSTEVTDQDMNAAITRYFKENGVLLERELMALEQAEHAIAQTKTVNSNEAVIIYSAEHDFTEACAQKKCDSLDYVTFKKPEETFMNSVWGFLGYGADDVAVTHQLIGSDVDTQPIHHEL